MHLCIQVARIALVEDFTVDKFSPVIDRYAIRKQRSDTAFLRRFQHFHIDILVHVKVSPQASPLILGLKLVVQHAFPVSGSVGSSYGRYRIDVMLVACLPVFIRVGRGRVFRAGAEPDRESEQEGNQPKNLFTHILLLQCFQQTGNAYLVGNDVIQL